MHPSQANRARIAQRATAPRVTLPPHLAPVSQVYATGPVRRSTALPMTGAQRDSRGHMSDWGRSAQIGGSLGSVIRDTKWSATVGDVG